MATDPYDEFSSASPGQSNIGSVNGRKFRVNGDGNTITFLDDGRDPYDEFSTAQAPSEVDKVTEFDKRAFGEPGVDDLSQHALSLGLDGVAAGVSNMLRGGTYAAGRQANDRRIEQARKRLGWGGTAVELVSGLAGAAPSKGLSALMSLGQAVKAGAIGGGATGAISAASGADGPVDALARAGVGGAAGAALGAGLPVAGSVAVNRLMGLGRLVGSNTGATARQLVGEAISRDAQTPAMVGQALQQAGQRGSPLTIADTGENVRALLGSVSRHPGGSRTVARDFVRQRQLEQGDRIVGAIDRDLGRTGNMFDASDELMQQARTAAAPLYQEAYATPSRTSDELESILATPAARGAMARARTIAANERRDPQAMGFGLDAEGNTTIERNPSIQTLDYLKRGLDDIIDSLPRQPNGRPIMDENYRAIDGVRRQFNTEVDRLNPTFAAARQAYAGPAAANSALKLGQGALNKSADEIERAVSLMGDAERAQYALGFRGAMVDALGRSPDGANSVGRILGTPRKRAALAQVMGGEAEFDRFLSSMNDERLMNETYQAVTGNSKTAERQLEDAQTGDAGLAETLGSVAVRGATSPVRALTDAFQALREVDRFGAGKAGDETRERVATLLTEADPTLLREIAIAVRRSRTLQKVRDRNVNRIGARSGSRVVSGLGSQIPSASGLQD